MPIKHRRKKDLDFQTAPFLQDLADPEDLEEMNVNDPWHVEGDPNVVGSRKKRLARAITQSIQLATDSTFSGREVVPK